MYVYLFLGKFPPYTCLLGTVRLIIFGKYFPTVCLFRPVPYKNCAILFGKNTQNMLKMDFFTSMIWVLSFFLKKIYFLTKISLKSRLLEQILGKPLYFYLFSQIFSPACLFHYIHDRLLIFWENSYLYFYYHLYY